MARVYQAVAYGDAQLRAAVVGDRGRADLWACRVRCFGMARGDCLWFITSHYAQATVRIHFGAEGSAELLVYFVGTPGMAGWRREHPWAGRLGP